MKRLFRVLFVSVAIATAMAFGVKADNPSAVVERVVPAPLAPGSKIAIVTPSWAVDTAAIEQGMGTLREWGFEPVAYPHAYGAGWGEYAACDSMRASDLMQAFSDPEISAIMCSRGGYGATRLLPMLDLEVIRSNPKWLIGYSDISALHALMDKAGIVSLHAPMCSHIGSHPDDESSEYLRSVLDTGLSLSYELEPNEYSVYGSASGRLVGGNFIVVNNLAGTEYDVFDIPDGDDVIIFVEEVGESIYAVERMLLRLHQSGTLNRASGIVFGEFTHYKPDSNFETMEDMISFWMREWGYSDRENYPMLYKFPAGHDEVNYPLALGAKVSLVVSPTGSYLVFD